VKNSHYGLAASLSVALTTFSSTPSLAGDPTSAGQVSIGTPPGFNSYGGLWNNALNAEFNFSQYTLLTTSSGTRTYLNVPSVAGPNNGEAILFRTDNSGTIRDPDGGLSLAYLTPGTAGGFYAYNVTAIDSLFANDIAISTANASKPGGGAWLSNSDERVKKDITEFTQGLAELEQVRPVSFKYNGLGDTVLDGKTYVGVVAQDLQRILPSMVTERKTKLHKDDAATTAIRQVDPSAFTYLLINSVKDLSSQVKELRAQERSMEEQIKVLESQNRLLARLAGEQRPEVAALGIASARLQK
jgi:hypothetical protein